MLSREQLVALLDATARGHEGYTKSLRPSPNRNHAEIAARHSLVASVCRRLLHAAEHSAPFEQKGEMFTVPDGIITKTMGWVDGEK